MSSEPRDDDSYMGTWIDVLLRRYGILTRALVQREPLAPPWYQLLRYLRRRELAGEVRGGRFVEGLEGEQFGLPDACEAMRHSRDQSKDGSWLVISGADPLNLTAVMPKAQRIGAVSANRLVYQDGSLIAARESGEVNMIAKDLDPSFIEIIKRAIRLQGSFRNRDPFVQIWNGKKIPNR